MQDKVMVNVEDGWRMGWGMGRNYFCKGYGGPVLGISIICTQSMRSQMREDARDFAYIYSWFKIAFEIQGYGPHLKQASRWSYADEQQRIRFLSSTGWTLMYFSYDEIKDSPEGCLQEIQSLLGRLIGRDSGGLTLSPVEKEIIRMAISRKGMIHAHDIYGEMNLHRNTVYRYLRSLVKQGWLEPAGDRYNIEYHLNPHKKHLF